MYNKDSNRGRLFSFTISSRHIWSYIQMGIYKFLCSAVILLIALTAAASPATAQSKSQNPKKLIETLRQQIEYLETQASDNSQNIVTLKNDLKGNTTLINSNYLEFNALRNNFEHNLTKINLNLLDNLRRIKLSSLKSDSLSADLLQDRYRRLNLSITKANLFNLQEIELDPEDYCNLHEQLKDLENNEDQERPDLLFAMIDECHAKIVDGVQANDLEDNQFDAISALLNRLFNFLKSLTMEPEAH